MSKGLRVALIASVAVVLLGLIGGGVFMYLQLERIATATPAAAIPAEGAGGDAAAALIFYKPAHFVTELADPAPKVRYVDVTVQLGFAAQKDADDAKNLDPIIRNTILQILRARTAQELSGAEGMLKLEKDLQEALVKQLRTLRKVSVTDLVIQ